MNKPTVVEAQIASGNTNLPPLGDLVSESLELFKIKIKPLILLQIIQMVISIFVLMVIGLLAIIFVILPLGLENLRESPEALKLAVINSLPQSMVSLMIIFVIFMFVVTFMAVIFQASIFKVLDKKIGIKQALRQSFKHAWTLLGASFLLSLLTMGGAFFFILPGFVVAMFLIFTPYEIVLSGQKVLPAMRNSVTMVKTHFWAVGGRLLLWFGVMVAFSIASDSISSDEGNILTLVYSVFNFLLSLFGTVFLYKLYRQVKDLTAHVKPISLKWIILVSLLGWTMFVLLIKFLIDNVLSYLPAVF
jgi:hypothetical protein